MSRRLFSGVLDEARGREAAILDNIDNTPYVHVILKRDRKTGRRAVATLRADAVPAVPLKGAIHRPNHAEGRG